MYRLTDAIVPLRAHADHEAKGMDSTTHGESVVQVSISAVSPRPLLIALAEGSEELNVTACCALLVVGRRTSPALSAAPAAPWPPRAPTAPWPPTTLGLRSTRCKRLDLALQWAAGMTEWEAGAAAKEERLSRRGETGCEGTLFRQPAFAVEACPPLKLLDYRC